MIIKNQVNYAADGIMDFIEATRNVHHVDELSLLTRVRKLCLERINLIEASDAERNK